MASHRPGVTLIALIGRLNQTFGVGKEFDVVTAAVLSGTSLFGGMGTAFGAVIRFSAGADGAGGHGAGGHDLPCGVLRFAARETPY
jgi:hypothetical protein